MKIRSLVSSLALSAALFLGGCGEEVSRMKVLRSSDISMAQCVDYSKQALKRYAIRADKEFDSTDERATVSGSNLLSNSRYEAQEYWGKVVIVRDKYQDSFEAEFTTEVRKHIPSPSGQGFETRVRRFRSITTELEILANIKSEYRDNASSPVFPSNK